MGYSFHTVLIDTFDYTAVTWDQLGDSIRQDNAELWEKVENRDVVGVMKMLGLVSEGESDPQEKGYRQEDYGVMYAILVDINDADGVVIATDEQHEEYLEVIMEKVGL